MNKTKDRIVTAMQKTGDPLAPLILADAYAATDRVGKLLASLGSRDATDAFTKTLLEGFPDDMDNIASDPSFIVALCSLLASALESYGRDLA